MEKGVAGRQAGGHGEEERGRQVASRGEEDRACLSPRMTTAG
jgi:hypothetical protein